MTESEGQRAARRRREAAARRFRPQKIELLLVAEAPPASLDRYFYFTDVPEHDHLFRYVVRVTLDGEPTRENKAELLGALQRKGIFLIDLSPDPLGEEPLVSFVPSLVVRCKKLQPNRIILIKTSVYDVAYLALKRGKLPVVDERIPFPSSGQQRRFVDVFGRALGAEPVERE